MNLNEMNVVRVILDEKYPKLRANVVRVRPNDDAFITINISSGIGITSVNDVDKVVQTCLTELKQLVERDLDNAQ